MFIIRILALTTLLGSIAWCWADPSYEPAIAIVTSLSTLVGLWLANKKSPEEPKQTQSLGNNSVGIQTQGDVSVGDISTNKETNNVK